MKKSRFIIVGSGWRAMFYVRIAKAFPEYFELGALLCRSVEKAEKVAKEYQIHTTISMVECENYQPDFVIVAVNKASIYDATKEWLQKGIAVLCETPAGLTLEQLNDLWNLHKAGAKIQVAEQYAHYPSYAAKINILNKNVLGEPYNITISEIHDYHAISIIRKILKTKFNMVKMYGKKFTFPVTETLTRYEKLFDGRMVDKDRSRLTFELENGKAAFYDFSSVQYRSTIRSKYINVQGSTGEMVNDSFYYLDSEYLPHCHNIDIKTFASGQVETIKFGEEIVYQSKYRDEGLSEDEIAITEFLCGMREFIETGKEIYPLADALQDAYLTILMEEALKYPNREVISEQQIWLED